MGKYRLYIADVDNRFISSVRKHIAQHRELELVGWSGNGRIALSEILRLRPDVVLTDMPLPELDGLALMQRVRRPGVTTAFIVCTRFYSQASMNCAFKLGASFFLCKPVDLHSLSTLLAECAGAADAAPAPSACDAGLNATSPRDAIARDLLRRLGISPKLDGSAYILEAIQCRPDEALLKNLSRGLYAEVARKMNTTVPRVERSLRSAIRIAYERGTLSDHFHRRPTNREFIAFMLQAVDKAGDPKKG